MPARAREERRPLGRPAPCGPGRRPRWLAGPRAIVSPCSPTTQGGDQGQQTSRTPCVPRGALSLGPPPCSPPPPPAQRMDVLARGLQTVPWLSSSALPAWRCLVCGPWVSSLAGDHVGPHAASTLPGQGAAGSVGMPHGVCASCVGCAGAAVALRCGGPFLTLSTLAEAAGDSRRAPLASAALPLVPLPPAGFSYGYLGWKRGAHQGRPRSRRPGLHRFHPPVTRRSAR
jgi:hypothetical protein